LDARLALCQSVELTSRAAIGFGRSSGLLENVRLGGMVGGKMSFARDNIGNLGGGNSPGAGKTVTRLAR
jgi:hypothetical protein